MSTNQTMLSTTDNPYNPFVQFDEWQAFDEQQGYYTCAYLARIVVTSDELSEEEQQADTERAIDEIVALNLTGNYIKIEEGKFEVNRTITKQEDALKLA